MSGKKKITDCTTCYWDAGFKGVTLKALEEYKAAGCPCRSCGDTNHWQDKNTYRPDASTPPPPPERNCDTCKWTRKEGCTNPDRVFAGGGSCEGYRYWEPREPPPAPTGAADNGTLRTFDTGATRDTAQNKPDYDGFLSPAVLEAYGAYMHRNRVQSDGTLRDSDNWQKGIPRDVYRKSAWRHFLAFWKHARSGEDGAATQDAMALMFNVMGWTHETIKKGGEKARAGEEKKGGA